jgi:hypothetical protein
MDTQRVRTTLDERLDPSLFVFDYLSIVLIPGVFFEIEPMEERYVMWLLYDEFDI